MLEGVLRSADVWEFGPWAKELSEAYHADPIALEVLLDRGSECNLVAFLAWWCPDCTREIPWLMHVLRKARWPTERLLLVGTDLNKRDPDGLVDQWQVSRVPTVILARANVELGRIVERSATSIEGDLAAILLGQS